MPILEIKALPQNDHNIIEDALIKTSTVIADYYNCNIKDVSIIWEEISPRHYVEGGKVADSQPDYTHPPMVKLICLEGSSKKIIRELLLLISQTLSHELKLKNNIFVTYQEVKKGQVVALNQLLE